MEAATRAKKQSLSCIATTPKASKNNSVGYDCFTGEMCRRDDDTGTVRVCNDEAGVQAVHKAQLHLFRMEAAFVALPVATSPVEVRRCIGDCDYPLPSEADHVRQMQFACRAIMREDRDNASPSRA